MFSKETNQASKTIFLNKSFSKMIESISNALDKGCAKKLGYSESS